MKRRSFLSIVIFALLVTAMFSLSAKASDFIGEMYANADYVYVYEAKDTNSDVIRYLSGGQSILVDSITENQKWAHVLMEASDGEGQEDGWVRMSDLVFTMPSQYCYHQWTDWQTIKEATCTQPGLLSTYCTICGLGETYETQPLGHSFGNWETVKPATCTSEGERISRCVRCGYDEHQKTEKLAHEYGDWTVIRQATCTAEGERSHKCKVCGAEEKQTVDRLPHNFGKWTVLKEATCTAEGEQSHKCQNCGFEEKATIEKIPHDFEWKVITEATDHSAGVRTNVCKVCGFTEEAVEFDPEGTLRRGDRSEEVREVQQLLADQNYLSADGADGIFGGGTEKALMEFQNDQGLAPDGVAWPQTIRRLHHDFGEWKVIKKATRSSAGERVRTCKECSYEQHETIPMSPYFEKGRRGEDVRAVQQMMTMLGYQTGSCDGIYGPLLDTAFEAFAEARKTEFEPGSITPAELDSMINEVIRQVPEDKWMKDQGLGTPVNMALTVNPLVGESPDNTDDVVECSWTLTNLGDTDCVFTALLLNFGEDQDFREDNLVVVLDGIDLKANCENSASGTFKVSRDWGKGVMNFCALAVDTEAGYVWLSNEDQIENGEEEPEESVVLEDMTEDPAENVLYEDMTENPEEQVLSEDTTEKD